MPLNQQNQDELEQALEAYKCKAMSRPGGWLQMFAGEEDDELKQLKEEIKDLRKENAKWRTQLRATEQERDEWKTKAEQAEPQVKSAKEASDALLKEVRTLLKLDDKADLPTIKAKIQEVLASPDQMWSKTERALIKAAFLAAGSGFVNPEAAYAIAEAGGKLKGFKVDPETLTVYPVDDKGQRLKVTVKKDGKDVQEDAVGVGGVVEGLKTSDPYLLGKPQQVGGGGSNPPQNQTQTEPGGLRSALNRQFGGQ